MSSISDAESESLILFFSSSREPNPHIEPLRFLEHGIRIACVEVTGVSIGVDEPGDVARVEQLLAEEAQNR